MIEKGMDIEKPEAGKFRTILPQILASTAKNFLLFDLGLAVAFPTILIPVLRGIVTTHPEKLYITAEQASWLGSIPFICQPIGSILSGLISDPIGRKKAMILVNIPHIIGWLLLHYSSTLEEVYIAAILLGLGVGFMEAPIITYVGEICQASIRGILTSCAGVSVMLGMFIVYLLGTVTDWRTAAIICLSVPVATMIAICFVPETPMWLLSKNRVDDASKSLQWLRGWVSEKSIETEFNEIKRYNENSNKCTPCQKAETKCEHPPEALKDKLKHLIRKRTLKPFILVMAYFTFSQFSGVPSMRPYMVQIFQAYNISVDASWATVLVGLLGLIAQIVCMIMVRIIGKRRLSLLSITGTTICCMWLGFYAYLNLPTNTSSFDTHEQYGEGNTLPMILFFAMSFFTSVGIATVPWMLLSEVFPFKSRGFATGITAALNYVITFISTKTYLNLEKGLQLHGVCWLYGIINVFGFIFLYFMLPETENRTLEDIETHFSINSRKLTDIKIKKILSTNNIEKTNENNGNINHKLENGCENKGYEN